MLSGGTSLKEVRYNFRWEIPSRYNMATDVCDRWADRNQDRIAIIHDHGDRIEEISYLQLYHGSNKLANLLTELGIGREDRVGILLPQNPWTAISHIAVWKIAGISIPLFTLFGEEALEYRLNDSAAKVIITNSEGTQKLSGIRHLLPNLSYILCIDKAIDNTLHLPACLKKGSTPVRVGRFIG